MPAEPTANIIELGATLTSANPTRADFDAAVTAALTAAAAYYHGDGTILMTDADYDILVERIAQASAAHGWDARGLLDAVAAGTTPAGGDVTHPQPMLSLTKLVAVDDVADFTASVGAPVIVEPKLDGLAVRAEYVDGHLTLVATRGDGRAGENVTAQAGNITGLPAQLARPLTVDVRGEVYMSDADFDEANTNRIAAGEPGYANPRNAVAGALRRENATYTSPMSFAAYDIALTSATNYAVAPGEYLAEWMLAHDRGADIADDLHLTDAELDDLLTGTRHLTAADAAGLHTLTGIPDEAWHADEAVYRADRVRLFGTYPERMAYAAELGLGTAAALTTNIPGYPEGFTPTTDPAVVLAQLDALHTARGTLEYTLSGDVAKAAAATDLNLAPTQNDGPHAAHVTLGYPIDGAVIKVTTYPDRDRLGTTGRHPRWAAAYKYPADTTTTTVEDVELSIGRTGRLGLRLRVAPTTVGGATITYASGHNVTWMLEQNIGIGTRVSLYRAGDVIPRAVALPADQQPEGVTAWTPPETCPQCGAEWDTSSVLWRCHTPSCSLTGAITYFCSRDAMDITGIGDVVADALVASGLVNDVADLFTLTADQLATLPLGVTPTGTVRHLGAANAATILAELDTSKAQPFNRVITALGIRMTGRSVGRWLAAAYPTMADLRAATVDDIATVDGLGPVKADHIVTGLAAMSDVIDRLAAAGVNMGTEQAPTGDLPFTGRTYVVSGSVPGYTRTTINERIEALGGKASSSVSKNTTALVTSETSTTKAKKAAALGVPVIDPAKFAAELAAH